MIKFPFTTLQQFNLDWIMQQLHKILDFMPLNGSAGDVLQRTADGAAWQPIAAISMDIHSLQPVPDYVAGNDELPIYDNSRQGIYKATVYDIMEEAPVQSVNGMTGDILLNIPSIPVDSVNGQTGDVVLDASDVGALPDSYVAPVTSVNGQTGDVVISTGAVQSVNGQTGAVVLDADDVGALPDSYVAPVTSVNGQTGDVVVGGAGSLVFGAAEVVGITAPAGVVVYANMIIQKTADGKAFRLTGKLSIEKGQNPSTRTITITGVSITAPTTDVHVYYCGLREVSGDTFTINYTNIYDAPTINVNTSGVISITAYQDYGSSGSFTHYWFPSVIVTLA